jgi:hypothetical protein
MKKIYLHNIIEEYPFLEFDKEIETITHFQWNSLVYNSDKILVEQYINIDSLPNQLSILDYKTENNIIETIVLKNLDNIKNQIENMDIDYRNKSELYSKATYNEDGTRSTIDVYINQILNHRAKFEYDENRNLIYENRYSRDISIITDKKIYSYDDNSNLIKISEYSDKSSGAGPNYLIEEYIYKYNSDDDLVASNESSKYLLSKKINGLFELTIVQKTDQKERIITKVYNEQKDVITEIFSTDLRYDYKRKYNIQGDQIELQTYINNILVCVVKSVVKRKSDS